jgi:hypothetical protein
VRMILIGLVGSVALAGLVPAAPFRQAKFEAKPRVFILTDIGVDPDDSESLVRFLFYSNEFDVEGIAAVTSTWMRSQVHPELIDERVKAFGVVQPNLMKHAAGYPTESHLEARIASGLPVYGLEGVGRDKDSAASDLLIAAVDRADSRPVWVTDWGGANVLAQALWKVRESRPPQQVDAFVAQLRVYTISDQDDAGPWIRRNFPKLFYVCSIHGFNEYYGATWWGISGEHMFHSDIGADFDKVSHEWLAQNIRKGPLGALYPDWKYIMEGDTPSFLYLIRNGLGVPDHPEYGSWGGRYVKLDADDGLYTDAADKVKSDSKVYVSNQATIWRWRESFQNDFAARIQWSLTPSFKQANHNPVLVVNGSDGQRPLEIEAVAGTQVTLDATGSNDPDRDRIAYHWWQYPEPSIPPFDRGRAPPDLQIQGENSIRASVTVPAVTRRTAYHVILEARDDGTPPLTSYRRVIVTVDPAAP